MPMPSHRAGVLLALSATLLLGCGGASEPDSEAASTQASAGCTERDGAWFGRSESGAMITSQTRAACEERLGQ